MPFLAFSKRELESIKKSFLDQLGFRLNENEIKNKIFENSQNLSAKKLQVIYLGGSHIESAVVNSKGKIRNFKSTKISPIQSEQEFLELIKNIIDPKVKEVVVSISANLQSFKNEYGVDSVLNSNHRIHNLDFLLNKPVGKYLTQKLGIKSGVKFSALNNLVSLAQGTVSKNISQKNTLFGIVATGVNFGYFDNNDTFLNLESGKLICNDKQVSTQVGEEFLYRIFNQESKKQKLGSELKNSIEFREILNSQNNRIKTLAQTVLKRSAQLVATKIATLIEHRNLQTENLEIILEGSLFWEVSGYKEMVLETLEVLEKSTKKIKLTRISFGFILGSAKIFRFNSAKERKQIRIVENLYSYFRTFTWNSLAPPNTI